MASKSNGKLSLKKQLAILEDCMANDTDLSKELESLNHTYDSLRYRTNDKVFDAKSSYFTVEEMAQKKNDIPTISFFTGCGGLDLGFENAGFGTIASFEINPIFCETIRKNRPEWNVFGPPDYSGDLRNIDEIETILRRKVGIGKQFEGVFHGGPPCQPFSIAANQRFAKWGDNFKRIGYSHENYGNLLFDYIHFIVNFKPRVFLIENVPGLKTVDKGEQISNALKLLSKNGYTVNKPFVLDAKDHRVPQTRKRLFIVGWRGKGDFEIPNGNYLPIPCYKAFERPLDGLANNETRRHKAESVRRYMELDYGERDHLGRVDRLSPNHPSKTVIAGGTKGGGRSHLHPFIPRTMSVRESARLQTFPDDFEFSGSTARQFTQVGNAVPPLLAHRLARSIHRGIYS